MGVAAEAGAAAGMGAAAEAGAPIDETGTAPTETIMLGPLGRAVELAFDGCSAQGDGVGTPVGGA
jgi:hypothetical protein